MLIAGTEKQLGPDTTALDGTTPLDDSQVPPPPPPETPPKETNQEQALEKARAHAAELLEGEDELRSQANQLRKMGLNARSVRKIMAGSTSVKHLNKKVTGYMALVFYLDGAEKVLKALRVTEKIASDKNIDAKVRVAAATCMAQCANIIANLGEKVEQSGKEYGGSEKPPAPVAPHTTNNFAVVVGGAGLPPVADASSRPTLLAPKST